jgi:hypothetical protein
MPAAKKATPATKRATKKATGARAPRLSDFELGELLALTKGADSVELKLTVPESTQRSAVLALGMDPLQAQIRQVFFFDTPELTLNQHGLVVRARRVQQRNDDSVVKLRPVVPEQIPATLRQSPAMVVEVDAMPGGYVCSATFKGALGTTDVLDVAAGQRPIRRLFSKDQRAFYAEHAPDGVGLDDLSIFGPINVFKLKFSPKDFGRRLVAEMWLYPDNSRILELSLKCPPSEMFQVAVETTAYLQGRGVDTSGDQQTKTTTALEFFAAELANKDT